MKRLLLEFKKKRTVFFLMLLAMVSTHAKAQFAPIGATWYYETQAIYSTGYIKMEVEKDTVINGYSCVKITRDAHWHDLFFNELKESPMSDLFLAQINDSVMVLHNGAFYKLFDFGAEIGETWTVVGREGLCEEDFGTVSVVDKGVEIINGIPLKYVTIKDDTYSYWGYGNTLYGTPSSAVRVMERIGPIGSYMLPEQKCLYDEAEGGPLRCYIDDELGELHLSSLYPERNCDYISEAYQSIDDGSFNVLLRVSPNPCSDKVRLLFDEEKEHKIVLFDHTGKVVLCRFEEGKETVLDIGNLPSGLYCITVSYEAEIRTTKFVKQ